MTERSMEHCTLCAEDGGHAPACPRWVPPPDATAAAARAARIARVDETARAIFAATFNLEETPDLKDCYPEPTKALAADCGAAYRFALALERARDEAIKELDSTPPRGEK